MAVVRERGASVDRQLIELAEKGDLAGVKTLLARGAHVEARDKFQFTALIRAAKSSHLEVVRYLIEHAQANVEARTHQGCTALHWGVVGKDARLVRYLVEEAKADAEATDDEGWTAVALGASGGHLSSVRYLVERAGARYEFKDINGLTPLDLARKSFRQEMVAYLQDVRIEGVKRALHRDLGGLFMLHPMMLSCVDSSASLCP
uniref:Uncharacterized protein n=1 Tax=Lotharella oceanica TaxID=641309 RepID=A0A7S2XEP6_9EUKA